MFSGCGQVLGIDRHSAAVAAMYSDAAGKIAALAKTGEERDDWFYRSLVMRCITRDKDSQKRLPTRAFLWKKFPKFVLGFLIVSILASMKVFSPWELKFLADFQRWMFALPSRELDSVPNFRTLLKQGSKPFIVGDNRRNVHCGGHASDSFLPLTIHSRLQ